MPKNFSDFTNLVLDRMASNPEEFMHHSPKSRWNTLIENLQDVARDPANNIARSLWALPKEEIDALVEAYRHIYLKDMHKHMLHQILSGSDVTARESTLERSLRPSINTDRYAVGLTDPKGFFGRQVIPEQYEKGQTVNDSPNYNRF